MEWGGVCFLLLWGIIVGSRVIFIFHNFVLPEVNVGGPWHSSTVVEEESIWFRKPAEMAANTQPCPTSSWWANAEYSEVDLSLAKEEEQIYFLFESKTLLWWQQFVGTYNSRTFSHKVYLNTVFSGKFAEMLNLEPIRTPVYTPRDVCSQWPAYIYNVNAASIENASYCLMKTNI